MSDPEVDLRQTGQQQNPTTQVKYVKSTSLGESPKLRGPSMSKVLVSQIVQRTQNPDDLCFLLQFVEYAQQLGQCGVRHLIFLFGHLFIIRCKHSVAELYEKAWMACISNRNVRRGLPLKGEEITPVLLSFHDVNLKAHRRSQEHHVDISDRCAIERRSQLSVKDRDAF